MLSALSRTLAVLLLLSLAACPPDKGDDTGTAGPTGGPGTSTATTTTTATETATTTAETTTTTTTTTTTAGTTGDTTTAAETTTTTGPGTTTGDVPGSSSGSTTGPGEGMFLCGACLCDSALAFCVQYHAGAILALPDPEPCEIVPFNEDELAGCMRYPDSCGDTPTCECISHENCDCSENMGTISIDCYLP